LEFIKPNIVTGKIEKIPVVDKKKREEIKPFVSSVVSSLDVSDGKFSVEYFDNTASSKPSEGFYKDYFQYDKVNKEFVRLNTWKR
jgi:hypothetical protein